MIILYIIGSVFVALILLGYFIEHFLYRPLRKEEPGFKYVHVEEDGSVRELYTDEIEYLNTEFDPTDSGRPYIKIRYKQLTPDKKMWGYILRRSVPPNIIIKPADQISPLQEY